jgi:hypothetical protein
MMSSHHQERLERLYGKVSFDQFFSGDRHVVPFPQAGRNKVGLPYDPNVVQAAVHRTPPELVDIDPRTLSASQPMVTRSGVEYYSGQEYDRTGETFADNEKAGNRFPVVYSRNDGTNIILSGHHRATAALLQGRPLRAINPSGGYGTR